MWTFYEIQISVSTNKVLLKHSCASLFIYCAKWHKILSAKRQKWVVETESECPTKSNVSCLTLYIPVTFRLAREPLTLDTVFLPFALDPLVSFSTFFPTTSHLTLLFSLAQLISQSLLSAAGWQGVGQEVGNEEAKAEEGGSALVWPQPGITKATRAFMPSGGTLSFLFWVIV